MNCGSILSQSIPTLQITDSVKKAKDCMGESGFEDLPVLQEQIFRGLLHISDLEELNDDLLLSELADHFTYLFVSEQDFFLVALNKMQNAHVQCLPVMGISGEYVGAITLERIADIVGRYLSASEPGGIIILQMPAHQFSISELGRIVESNNAKILHLATWTDPAIGELMVSMKVNKIDIQDILASFERYEFAVYQYFGENLSEDTLKNNFDNLMHYLRL
ncbi:MAG: CBS domain-containing protein [Bacteroidota bacterium]|jgi:acetoin utilization protein AcuB